MRRKKHDRSAGRSMTNPAQGRNCEAGCFALDARGRTYRALILDGGGHPNCYGG